MDKNQYSIIELPKICDPRGNLTVAESMKQVPFEVRRVYWTYDVPSGESRGGHAHKQCLEIIIAISGSFTVTLDNGKEKQAFHLNHPWQGLLVHDALPICLWRLAFGALSTISRREPCVLCLPPILTTNRIISMNTTIS